MVYSSKIDDDIFLIGQCKSILRFSDPFEMQENVFRNPHTVKTTIIRIRILTSD